MAGKSIPFAPSVVVETVPPKVTTTVKNVDGDIVGKVEQGSTGEIARAYIGADSVFNEIAIITLDMLTDLAKDKYSKMIVAGHNNDSALAGYRTTLLHDMVKSAHKQLVERVKEKKDKDGRIFYRAMRAKGATVCEATKLSGYTPDDAVCTCKNCIATK